MLNEQEILKEESKWAKEKDLIERQQKIKNERKALKKNKNKTCSTTKLLILFLFLNCTAIEIFTGWATAQSLKNSLITGQMVDFSPLITLIGAVVGEVMGFGIYAIKSMKENTVGGVVYATALKNDSENAVG